MFVCMRACALARVRSAVRSGAVRCKAVPCGAVPSVPRVRWCGCAGVRASGRAMAKGCGQADGRVGVGVCVCGCLCVRVCACARVRACVSVCSLAVLLDTDSYPPFAWLVPHTMHAK